MSYIIFLAHKHFSKFSYFRPTVEQNYFNES